jgi:cell division septum initiation protein DivIVA
MHGSDDEVIPLHPPFETVLRGFHRQQVVDYFEVLEGRLAMVEADRDAALGQAAELARVLEHLRREAEDATTRLELLQRSSLAGAGARIQRMMQLAEEELTELQASTRQETNALRERTRADADQLLGETTERCRRMEAEASTRAEEFQARALVRLYALLMFAGERLTSSTTEAEREVAELTELRTEVTSQLSSVHRRLAEALGHHAPGHDAPGDDALGHAQPIDQELAPADAAPAEPAPTEPAAEGERRG